MVYWFVISCYGVGCLRVVFDVLLYCLFGCYLCCLFVYCLVLAF